MPYNVFSSSNLSSARIIGFGFFSVIKLNLSVSRYRTYGRVSVAIFTPARTIFTNSFYLTLNGLIDDIIAGLSFPY